VPDRSICVTQPAGSIDLLTAQAGTRTQATPAADGGASRVPRDRRRRDRRLCPCQLRAGGLCAVRGRAPLLICSGAASRRGLPYGGSTRFHGGSTRRQGHLGRFTGLRLRCGDRRAAAGGCHCAALMIRRRAAAATVRPCVRPDPGSPLSSFPQVTCADWWGWAGAAASFRLRIAGPARPFVLAWSGDRSPVRGCITTGGDRVPPSDTTFPQVSGRISGQQRGVTLH
jgi:hypothetical protein